MQTRILGMAVLLPDSSTNLPQGNAAHPFHLFLLHCFHHNLTLNFTHTPVQTTPNHLLLLPLHINALFLHLLPPLPHLHLIYLFQQQCHKHRHSFNTQYHKAFLLHHTCLPLGPLLSSIRNSNDGSLIPAIGWDWELHTMLHMPQQEYYMVNSLSTDHVDEQNFGRPLQTIGFLRSGPWVLIFALHEFVIPRFKPR